METSNEVNWFCFLNKFSIIHIQYITLIIGPFPNRAVPWLTFPLGQISDWHFPKRKLPRGTLSWSDDNSPAGHFPDKEVPNQTFSHYDIYLTVPFRDPIFPRPCFIFALFMLLYLFIKLGLICRPHKDVLLTLLVFGERTKWIYLHYLKDLSPAAIVIMEF